MPLHHRSCAWALAALAASGCSSGQAGAGGSAGELPSPAPAFPAECVIETGPGGMTPVSVAALDGDDGLGAVQPKLLLDAGTVNSVGVAFDRHGAGADIGYGEDDGPAFSRSASIPAFTGGAVLLRAAFLRDLGGFDERYFLYYEDVDLALRGAERGWRYRCIPASAVRHAQGSSTAELGDELAFLRERNRLWTCFRFHGAATIGRACWLGVRRVRHRPRSAHARALGAGLAGAPRRLLERWRAGRTRAAA